MNNYYENTCIKFVPRTTEYDYINIIKDRGYMNFVNLIKFFKMNFLDVTQTLVEQVACKLSPLVMVVTLWALLFMHVFIFYM